MSNCIEIIEINKLIKNHFVIPSYQRGYRWDKKQVEDLLNDILEFRDKPAKSDDEFYCLQPIVVKKTKNGEYDVIDGQQRLTTIMIILKYLNKMTYSINYVSRKGSKDFLDNICNESQNDISDRNIDFFFMKTAYNVVRDWFETKKDELDEPTLGDELYIVLGKKCKVIWYVVDDYANVENVFTRLNIGKIPLTNAELIKALFLQSKLLSSNEEVIKLRQLEIASEWDEIENNLQNEQLWYFINPSRDEMSTRIEYIFEAVSKTESKEDDYNTFRYFQKHLETTSLIDTWQEIKQYYQIIIEWFNDRTLYHLIGYLTSKEVGYSLQDIIDEYKNHTYSKPEFVTLIKEYVIDSIEGIDIASLTYENANEVKCILLLFNVITAINTGNVYARFPFDEYKKNIWSLEHIHAQNSKGLAKQEQWKAWIGEHIKSFKSFEGERYFNIVKKLEEIDTSKLTRESFDELFNDILLQIKDDYGEKDMHSISNLALLDKDTNSYLNNALFDVKRARIVELDKKGMFIPLCTRNVFLKYYSKDPQHIHFWNEDDRNDYLTCIIDTLSDYLGFDKGESVSYGEEDDDLYILEIDE